MDLGLTGRVAVIGGGSKGLGRACADSLAQEGTNLAICSRNAEELETAAAEIRAAAGVEVLAVPGDLSRLEDIQRLVQTTVDHYGRLDIAVANSGGPPSGRAADTDEETWSRSIDMALSFFIRMGREATPHMRQRKWGRIVKYPGLHRLPAHRQPGDLRRYPHGRRGLRQEPGRRGGTR